MNGSFVLKRKKKEKSVVLLTTYLSLFLPKENFSGTAIFRKFGYGAFFFLFWNFSEKGKKKLFLDKKSGKKKGIFGKFLSPRKFWNPNKGDFLPL